MHAPGLPAQPAPWQGLGPGTSRRSGCQVQEVLWTLTVLRRESRLLCLSWRPSLTRPPGAAHVLAGTSRDQPRILQGGVGASMRNDPPAVWGELTGSLGGWQVRRRQDEVRRARVSSGQVALPSSTWRSSG